MSLRALIIVLLLTSGCSLARQRARSAVDETRLKEARAVAAERVAPLAFANYRAAQKKAAVLDPDSAARADYEAEARLWLETAIATGERARVAEQRLGEERAQLELDSAIVPLQRQRAELARRAELLAARQIARVEAERSLARAAQRPDLRVRIPREEAKRTAEALLARAALIALTLESIDAQSPGLAKLRAQLGAAEAQVARDPEGSLVRADQTLFFALSLLAPLRGEEPPPEQEKATLSEELALIGAQVSRSDHGLSALFERAFSGNTLAGPSERALEQLCALTRAHIKGPVRLDTHATSAAQGEARARALRTRLAQAGCTGARFAFVATPNEGDGLEASFVAY